MQYLRFEANQKANELSKKVLEVFDAKIVADQSRKSMDREKALLESAISKLDLLKSQVTQLEKNILVVSNIEQEAQHL